MGREKRNPKRREMCKIPGPWGDGLDDMRPIRLDPETANRLAAGALSPDDAPPGYAGVAQLLSEARSASSVGSSGKASATVAAMQAAVAGELGRPSDIQGRKMLSKILTVKAAVAAGAVLLGAGTAAAATGSLPSSAQSAVHGALANLDISVPNGNTNSSTTDSGKSSSSGKANANALPGLCNAASHNGTITTTSNPKTTKPNSHSVFGSITSSTCSGVSAPGNSGTAGSGTSDSTGGATPDSGSGTGQGGKPSSVPPGPPSGVSTPASVNTPNRGTSGTSGSGASSSGLGTASGSDSGASSTGSGAASSGAGNGASHS